ncbi:Hypothetical Protein FCC1311_087802 [Hondaea fermentalgiana]|uniref:Uncharacterized protein n=1 Tax=Hondaea fermentalgiana TaxID=2315210 RepID=A0A2R5GNT4_9STRA|nr:Hypothetical Protein FCC1311_087802 [Hondaea fermentalgiana]|eukprot:GBG32556.1 Hypothetical Protein FCC1311_087802 [Hondaea fermentalgiana]
MSKCGIHRVDPERVVVHKRAHLFAHFRPARNKLGGGHLARKNCIRDKRVLINNAWARSKLLDLFALRIQLLQSTRLKHEHLRVRRKGRNSELLLLRFKPSRR